MKKTFTIIFIVLIAIAVIFLVSDKIKLTSQKIEESPNSRSYKTEAKNNKHNEKAAAPSADPEKLLFEKTYSAFTKEEESSKPANVPWKDWGYYVALHRSKKLQESEVEFYGIVVDENEKPIPGVLLQVTMDYTPSISKTIGGQMHGHEEMRNLTTDTNGQFSVTKFSASGLIIMNLQKEGYVLPSKKKFWGFHFDPAMTQFHKPDKTKPVVFRMVKAPY